MIQYDPKNWWNVFWAWRGTVMPSIWRRTAILIALTIAVFAVGEIVPLLSFGGKHYQVPALNPLGHTLMGVVLGLLLVFRTNSSYDRFWEGRKLWGSLVNASRNLVRCGAAHVGDASELARLTAAYVRCVKQTLRSERDLSEIRDLVIPEVLAQAEAVANPPSVIAYHISAWVQRQLRERKIENNGQLLRLLEMHLGTMVDSQGGCERILRTPIPFVYAAQIRHLLLIYLATLPFVLVPIMGWCAPLAVAAVSFGLLGIESAGLEIEDPFGDDPNDLPLDDICAVIQRDTTMLAELPKK